MWNQSLYGESHFFSCTSLKAQKPRPTWVEHTVEHYADAALVQGGDQLFEVAVRAQARCPRGG